MAASADMEVVHTAESLAPESSSVATGTAQHLAVRRVKHMVKSYGQDVVVRTDMALAATQAALVEDKGKVQALKDADMVAWAVVRLDERIV